ncbi:MAG: ABC transporter permease [Eubacteriales bacterium]|nr:ABC transporter permease [Eubacteriales bacterium]
MKSYLGLIPASAGVRGRQNRMTRLCIMFSVFLVTAVFSMAEAGIRMERSRLLQKHGGASVEALAESSSGQTILLTAAVLSVLILTAGALMIAGSMNSSVRQRTEFFGMLRCLGMSRAQVRIFVRLEALCWCKTAVPAGIVLGTAVSWLLCAALHYLVGEEFAEIPVFGVSITGIVSGSVVGIVSVLLSAGAPARRAARVSPLAALSGNDGRENRGKRAPRALHGRIEAALGYRHAFASGKTALLLTASFALSILLFLCFSVIVETVGYIMPQSSAAPDIEIIGAERSAPAGKERDGESDSALVEQEKGGESVSTLIKSEIAETLRGMDGVSQVYGRRSALDVPASGEGELSAVTAVDLVSFDTFELETLEKDHALQRGASVSRVSEGGGYALATWDPESTWKKGDVIEVAGERLEIAGLLRCDPFSEDGMTNGRLTLIVSGETFTRLTGQADYTLLMIRTSGDVSESEEEAMRCAAGQDVVFIDRREQSTAGTYLAFVICGYSFLGIIALVAVLNIVNSIAMGVTARVREYGMMRAVGMDGRQLTGMILTEASAYSLWGCAAGCAVGLPLHKFLFERLITAHFPYAVWSVPVPALAVIIGFIAGAALLAGGLPAARIRKLSVTETIAEL